MENNTNEIINRLNFENLIWICFIVISALDIYGDELIKKSLKNNDTHCRKKADKLFLGITLFSILIYLYFFALIIYNLPGLPLCNQYVDFLGWDLPLISVPLEAP